MRVCVRAEAGGEHSSPSRPDLAIYRNYTVALLRRYFRLSLEAGRLPSLLGREFFRTRITSYQVQTFEDTVIFVHDVERCLEKLDRFSQKLIARIVLQDYSQEEAAVILGCHPAHRGTALSRSAGRVERHLSPMQAAAAVRFAARRPLWKSLGPGLSRGRKRLFVGNCLARKEIKSCGGCLIWPDECAILELESKKKESFRGALSALFFCGPETELEDRKTQAAKR